MESIRQSGENQKQKKRLESEVEALKAEYEKKKATFEKKWRKSVQNEVIDVGEEK